MTSYELRISDWSSDVCASDLTVGPGAADGDPGRHGPAGWRRARRGRADLAAGIVPVAGAVRRLCQALAPAAEIGRAAFRERVCQYVLILVVALSLTKKIMLTSVVVLSLIYSILTSYYI